MLMPQGLSPRPVTVADVAAAARVSKAAAARVLGGYGSVSSGVKARVLDAARALDYRPNELARTMTTGRSGTIGVVVGDIENPFFGLAVRGLSDRARELGFNVILANSGEDVAAEQAATRVLAAKRVDGLVVAPAAMDRADHLADLVGRGCPLVLLDRDIPSLGVDASLVDTRSGACNATALLLAAGHRRLAYVTASEAAETRYRGPEQVALSTVLDRIGGFVATLRGAEIDDPEAGIRLGATNPARAAEILDALLCGPDRVTAILASDSKNRAARVPGGAPARPGPSGRGIAGQLRRCGLDKRHHARRHGRGAAGLRTRRASGPAVGRPHRRPCRPPSLLPARHHPDPARVGGAAYQNRRVASPPANGAEAQDLRRY